ncbi:hypothetical protein DWX43_17075 [Clostridium sp. AF19-22AC]|jgi:pilin isopeptide linkage protein|uniref:Spy0128 family protein n=1 Tax=Clostridia TaxID=186801 RepID=UPI000E4CA73E|nr:MULTISPECIES: FctA domain-containing protein [Clostridia]RHR25837.1 hypothetical protein DWX43_17075 [Clostridium sp. AF19-22AC]
MEKSKRKNILVNLQAFFILFLLTLFICKPVYASEKAVSVSLDVNQSFSLEKGTAPTDQFYYKLTATEENNPMPDGHLGGEYAFSIQGNSKYMMKPMTYQAPGTYSYQLVQTVENEAEGYTYDKRSYGITVYVKNGQSGNYITELIIKNESGEKVSGITYQNTYNKKDTIVNTPIVTPGNNASHANPIKTGDTSNLTIWALLAFIALGCLLVIIKTKKR